MQVVVLELADVLIPLRVCPRALAMGAAIHNSTGVCPAINLEGLAIGVRAREQSAGQQ